MIAVMANSLDSWRRESDAACKLADDINTMIFESRSHLSTVRRKITILGTRLDNLESLLSTLRGRQKL